VIRQSMGHAVDDAELSSEQAVDILVFCVATWRKRWYALYTPSLGRPWLDYELSKFSVCHSVNVAEEEMVYG
jgi:hypothetical protein